MDTIKDKVKVLFIFTDTHYGGGSKYFGQVMNGLSERGFDFTIGCRYDSYIKKYCDDRGIKTIPFEVKSRFDIPGMLKFSHMIKPLHFDIACLGDGAAWTTGVPLSLFSSVKATIPIVHITHIGLELKDSYGWLERTLTKAWDCLWARFATRILVSNEKNASILASEGVDRNKMRIIYNYPEIKGFSLESAPQKADILAEYGISSERVVIGMMARLGPGKDFENLFQAIPYVIREYPLAHFIVVGDGPFRERLEKKIREISIEDHITLTGFKENPYNYLNIFDIVVLSTMAEGVPNLILEGMFFGKPIVATDSGAIADAIQNYETGILVPPRNPAELAKGLLAILKNADLGKRLGENAKELVSKKFTKEQMWDGFEKMLLEALEESRSQ